MTKQDFIIRPIKPSEIDHVADFISTGYYHDKFFKWSVNCDATRHKIVADYYKIYLGAAGCVAHIAQRPDGTIIGATVWLPHDTDAGIYDEIDRVVGEVNAPQFRAVADRSHDSEPPIGPFYQLVGFVVQRDTQGMGVGGALLKHHLDILDPLGIPTYLEASTPYFGGGVYGRFGYQQVGELMVFAETAVLYPLWRSAGGMPDGSADGVEVQAEKPVNTGAKKVWQKRQNCTDTDTDNLCQNQKVRFGAFDWYVLSKQDGKLLLLCDKVVALRGYHDVFEDVIWENSSARAYLNGVFYSEFTPEEQAQIADTHVCNHGNPWFGVGGGADTADKVFLLSVEEVAAYLGDSGQLESPESMFFVDDRFNDARVATCAGGLGNKCSVGIGEAGNGDCQPVRWALRTPGNMSGLVATVTNEGKIAMTGDFVNRESTELFNAGLRPAMWVVGTCFNSL